MIQRLRSKVEQIEGRLSRRAALLGDDSRQACAAAPRTRATALAAADAARRAHCVRRCAASPPETSRAPQHSCVAALLHR